MKGVYSFDEATNTEEFIAWSNVTEFGLERPVTHQNREFPMDFFFIEGNEKKFSHPVEALENYDLLEIICEEMTSTTLIQGEIGLYD